MRALRAHTCSPRRVLAGYAGSARVGEPRLEDWDVELGAETGIRERRCGAPGDDGRPWRGQCANLLG